MSITDVPQTVPLIELLVGNIYSLHFVGTILPKAHLLHSVILIFLGSTLIKPIYSSVRRKFIGNILQKAHLL